LKKKVFLREWELSYRLGMWNASKLTLFAFNACPEKCENISLEKSELSRNREAPLFIYFSKKNKK
jgi:hypothetical protein